MNPEARVTHQVMPNQFTIENQAEFEANTLQPILAQVAAELYKFLFYADCLHEVTELTKGDLCVSERIELNENMSHY